MHYKVILDEEIKRLRVVADQLGKGTRLYDDDLRDLSHIIWVIINRVDDRGSLMTRQDYVSVAQIIREFDYNQGTDPDVRRQLFALAFMHMLEQGNPNFNRKEFLKACGVEYYGLLAEAS